MLLLSLLLAACAGQAGDPVEGRRIYSMETLGSRQAPGCITCHSLEPGEVKVGPSHAEVGGRAEALLLSDDYSGQAESAAEYLRESILEPNVHVVEGFEPGVMYQKYEEVLTEDQVKDLVAFLLTLR